MLAKFELGVVRTLELTGYTVTFHSRCTTAFLFEQLVTVGFRCCTETHAEGQQQDVFLVSAKILHNPRHS